jgi:hypothetical protein
MINALGPTGGSMRHLPNALIITHQSILNSQLVKTAEQRLLDREDPNSAALRHFGEFSWAGRVEASLHGARVDSPTGLHGDVLFAVGPGRDSSRNHK